MGTLWIEMGAVSAREGAKFIWVQILQKWAHLVYVGALWAEMGAIPNLPKSVIYFHAEVFVRGHTKSTGECDLFPRRCIY